MAYSDEELRGAYQQYLERYAMHHPRPQRQQAERDDHLVRLALLLLVLASVFVSATRTISEFASSYQPGTFVGVAAGVSAFVMIELGIVAYAYIRTKHRHETGGRVGMGRWIDAGLYLSLVVALVGNMDFVIQSRVPALETAVSVLLAVSAPLLAFISGDILGVLEVTRRKAQAELDQQYQQELSAWLEAANAAFEANRQQAVHVYRASVSGGVRKVSGGVRQVSTPGQVDSGQDDWTGQPDTGQDRRTALDILRDYRDSNPDEYANASSRALANALGLGKTAVHNARQQLDREAASHD